MDEDKDKDEDKDDVMSISQIVIQFCLFSSSPRSARANRTPSPLTTGSRRKATFTVGSPSTPSPSSSPLSRAVFNQSPSRNSPSPKHDKTPPNIQSAVSQSSYSQISPNNRVSPSFQIPGSNTIEVYSRDVTGPGDDGYSRSAPIMVPHPRRSSFSSSLKFPLNSSSSTASSSPARCSVTKTHTSPSAAPCSATPTNAETRLASPTLVDAANKFPVKVFEKSPCESPASTQSPSMSPILTTFSRFSPDKAGLVTDLSFAGLLHTKAKDKPIMKTQSSPSLSAPGTWALEAKSGNRLTSANSPFKFSSSKDFAVSSTVKRNLGCIPFRGQAAGAFTRIQCKPPPSSLLPAVTCSSPSPPYVTSTGEGDEMKPLKGIFFGENSLFAWRMAFNYEYDYEIRYFWRQFLASSPADVIKS